MDNITHAFAGAAMANALLPAGLPVETRASCATAHLLAATSAGATVTDRVVWHQRWVVDVDRLRTMAERDCRVRAWLQFARIPYVADDRVADLRYENPFRSNFSEMTLQTPAGCPSNLTDWDPPRRDLLQR